MTDEQAAACNRCGQSTKLPVNVLAGHAGEVVCSNCSTAAMMGDRGAHVARARELRQQQQLTGWRDQQPQRVTGWFGDRGGYQEARIGEPGMLAEAASLLTAAVDAYLTGDAVAVVLSGNPGVGKTRAAVAVLNEVAARSPRQVGLVAGSEFRLFAGKPWERLEKAQSIAAAAEVLMIDDVGTAPLGGDDDRWALYLALLAEHERLHKAGLVILTTNRSMTGPGSVWEWLGPQAASRISGMGRWAPAGRLFVAWPKDSTAKDVRQRHRYST